MRGQTYSGAGIDRLDHRRRDRAWLGQQWRAPTARVLPVWHGRCLIAGAEDARIALLPASAVADLHDPAAPPVFLGQDHRAVYFSADVSAVAAADQTPPFRQWGRFENLRDVTAILPRPDAALLAYAKGLFHWHARHLYCGACGSKTASRDGGHVRVCTGSGCAISHFPRTDPAVIMLVTDGERCLLGHNRRFPSKLYSALAGFVEPGESLEEAVRREIQEESGIVVRSPKYFSSQPWPFPSSLMLGFFAEAETKAITVDRFEMADVRWFGRAELRDHERLGFRLPGADSIARQLLEHWRGTGPGA